MNTNPPNEPPAQTPAKNVAVKVFGVGGAGIKILDEIARRTLPGASFIAVNTDAHSMETLGAVEKIAFESKLLRGLGTGGDPERGRAAAEEHLPQLKDACAGADVVFILAGLGGGAGTGISTVLARAAKEAGALVLAFVALPFDCEGNRRRLQAQHGLEQLKDEADGVICLPNQRAFKLIEEDTSVIDTFKLTNGLLSDGVCGIWRLMAQKGLIDIHFSDLCAMLRDRHGESSFASAEAFGPTRSREVLDKLLAHPMLDGGQVLAESDAVLVSFTGGADLTMVEIHRVMEQINQQCGRAQVLMGAAIDERFAERLAVTIVATRRQEQAVGRDEPVTAHDSGDGDELGGQLLSRANTGRPHSRFVPPPPALPPDKMEQLLARHRSGVARQRKQSPRMRQAQLPLEIVSRGRFDKSEPTIHKGEDLDVPTYIRRGVLLN
jgi:cell division protein FtsZ